MNFRTEISIPTAMNKIQHPDVIFLIGSCFAENMAQKLVNAGFSVLHNPLGELYNPLSIQAAVELITGRRTLDEGDLLFRDGLWHSFYHHSSFSCRQKQELLTKMEQSFTKTKDFLKKARWAMITLGTAFVYRYKPSGRIVANCHKVPASQFERFRLSVNQITEALQATFELLHTLNPELRMVLTVSPIRHLKNGMAENQRSKAALILAVSQMIAESDHAEYFPAYEIMMDDLRDYRFYADNLTHPSQAAVQYIWEKFAETYFSAECKKAVADMEKLHQALNHRPLHPDSESFLRFIRGQLENLKRLKTQYPHIDFTDPESYFRSFLEK